jgi:hypothetical protein
VLEDSLKKSSTTPQVSMPLEIGKYLESKKFLENEVEKDSALDIFYL